MSRKSGASYIWSLWVLIGLGTQACAPLTTGGTNGVVGCTAFTLDVAGQQAGLGQIGGTIPPATAIQLAQSFRAGVTKKIPGASVKLDAVYPVGSSLNTTITLEIQADASGTTSPPTPTTPSGSDLVDPNTGGFANATISASTISLSPASQYYNFAFSSSGTTYSVPLTQGNIYWIILSTTASSATNYVEWRGASSSQLYLLSLYLISVGSWGSPGTNENFDFQVGC
jgi:hypothetical protein